MLCGHRCFLVGLAQSLKARGLGGTPEKVIMGPFCVKTCSADGMDGRWAADLFTRGTRETTLFLLVGPIAW